MATSSRFLWTSDRRPAALAGVGLLLVLALALGCRGAIQLFRAGDHVARLPDARFLRGTVAAEQTGGVLFVVALAGDDPIALHESDAGGDWWISVPPGLYRVAAFQDRNGDRIRQPGEPSTLHGDHHDLRDAVLRDGVELALPSEDGPFPDLSIDLADADFGVPIRLGRAAVGKVVPLDDERFSAEQGRRGLWQPMDFLEEPGGGIFFMEPYDPERVPVLFVHGMSGSPSEFTTLVEGIDRSRFQAWVLQYPSAMRLEQIADSVAYALERLHQEHDFERLALVAHSMGGLLARAYLNDRARRPGGYRIAPFVSIATPWAGQASAETGVERSPVVIPSWRDMAPSSHFLTGLFSVPLPEGTEHHLFFAFEGNRARAGAPVDDGVVTLASQLSPDAQAGAVRRLGFAENHTSVLRSERTVEALNAALRSGD